MLVESVELKEGIPVQWMGVYALKWQPEWGQPTVGFREPEPCEWKQERGSSEVWETSCGEAFYFVDGGPEDNGMKYCPYCGHPLEVTYWEEIES